MGKRSQRKISGSLPAHVGGGAQKKKEKLDIREEKKEEKNERVCGVQ